VISFDVSNAIYETWSYHEKYTFDFINPNPTAVTGKHQ